MPGEYYSPTQPFPLNGRGQPFNYDRQGFVDDDLIDFTPELRAEGLKVISRNTRYGPIFTPPVVSKIDGPLATLTLASAGGGTNWPGGSYDPETQHPLCELAEVASASWDSSPPRDRDEERSAVRDGQCVDRRADDAGAGSAAGGERAVAPGTPAARCGRARLRGEGGGGGARADRSGASDHEAARTASCGDRSRQGRSDLAGRARRDARDDSEPRGAQGDEHSAHRASGRRRSLDTKTLLISGEAGFGPTPTGARGAMLRAYDKATREGSGRGLHAGAANGIADDVHVERPAVSRRRGQRRRILR